MAERRCWVLWGFEGWRRPRSTLVPGLLEVVDGLFDKEIGAGVARHVISRVRVGRSRRDRPSGSQGRMDESVIEFSPEALAAGGLKV